MRIHVVSNAIFLRWLCLPNVGNRFKTGCQKVFNFEIIIIFLESMNFSIMPCFSFDALLLSLWMGTCGARNHHSKRFEVMLLFEAGFCWPTTKHSNCCFQTTTISPKCESLRVNLFYVCMFNLSACYLGCHLTQIIKNRWNRFRPYMCHRMRFSRCFTEP